jgi:hypothetical protein
MPGRDSFRFNDVEGDALLLVEGIDDARFFTAFLQWLGKTNVQIAQVGGKDELRPFLINILKNAPNFPRLRSLGIVRDADTSASSALQSLGNSLDTAQLPSPSQAWESAQADGLAVSLAILPDGTSPGDLENLCLRSIGKSREIECVDEYIDCRVKASAQIASNKLAKTKVHTYLAVGIDGNDPGLRLGESADAGVWDWDSPAFENVADFLRNLSSLSSPEPPK